MQEGLSSRGAGPCSVDTRIGTVGASPRMGWLRVRGTNMRMATPASASVYGSRALRQEHDPCMHR